MIRARYIQTLEQYGWALLSFAFLPGLLFCKADMVARIFQYVVILPVGIYLLLNPVVLKKINLDKNHINKAAIIFFLFVTYTLLSFGWSSEKIYENRFVFKCVGVCALFILVFLICRYSEKKVHLIETLYLWGGTLCLMIAMWQSRMDITLLDTLQKKGGYNYHVYVSWLAATLALILLARKKSLSLLDSALLCFYIYSIVFSQSRGGLITLVCGYLCMLFLQDNPLREKKVILCVVLTLVFAFVFNPFSMKKMIGKQFGERPRIWEHSIQQNAPVISSEENKTDTAKIKKTVKDIRYRNLYLGMLREGGVVTLLLYASLLLLVIYRGLRSAVQTPWPYIVVGMSTTMVVHGENFFVAPSPLMTCLIIPLFFTLFLSSPKSRLPS